MAIEIVARPEIHPSQRQVELERLCPGPSLQVHFGLGELVLKEEPSVGRPLVIAEAAFGVQLDDAPLQ